MERVVITGFSALTSLGLDFSTSWEQLKLGKTGIAPLSEGNKWDIGEYPYSLAGELKEFDPRQKIFDKKILKVISRHDVYGLDAAQQAMNHSGLLEYRSNLADQTEFNERSGMYVGSPGNKYYQQYEFIPLFANSKGDTREFATELFSQVNPMWLLKILPNNVLAYAAIHYGFKGANQNITNHGVSGLQAIIEAFHAIQYGLIDRALVIAYDAAVEPQSILYFGESGLLSAKGIKPFDQQRDGTVLAEGAGAILLESASAAKARNAKTYGEILAGASASEAMGIFSLEENGEGLSRLMQQTLDEAQITTSDIGMITAHGNGNILSDASEAQAISDVFATQAPVTSFKWATGHTLSAAGVIDSLFTLAALRENSAPGIATLQQLAADCENISVSTSSQPVNSPLGLVLNRGFGGFNASLVIKAL